ncbi:MAG: hypothetical protein JSS20_04535 [Proteobacteria bacterium]|nr:hypothetical protein [Pseudomonadota bacterium]
MSLVKKFALASSMLLWSIPSSHALIWHCSAPEIDGPAGLSAIAALVSAGFIAYERIRG